MTEISTPGALPVHAVTYTYTDDAERIAELRPSHRTFLRGLHETGALLASGPYLDGADALLIVRADDADAALALLEDDPFFGAELIASRSARPWNPVIGPWQS